MLEGVENEVGEDPARQLSVLERHEDTGPAMPWLLALTAAEEDDASSNAVLAMENSSTTWTTGASPAGLLLRGQPLSAASGEQCDQTKYSEHL